MAEVKVKVLVGSLRLDLPRAPQGRQPLRTLEDGRQEYDLQRGDVADVEETRARTMAGLGSVEIIQDGGKEGEAPAPTPPEGEKAPPAEPEAPAEAETGPPAAPRAPKRAPRGRRGA